MFEKVNPAHPDKIADRIAGAMVDLAYRKTDNPKLAVEVLIGHGKCHIIAETSVKFSKREIKQIVYRIAGKVKIDFVQVPQDMHLANNQKDTIRCGDNGVFKGSPITDEQRNLSELARSLYERYKSDGKYIVHNNALTVCQSNAKSEELKLRLTCAKVNPLGDWTGGTTVDTGATNRKLGSDMGNAVTGGGLHGKDLSKADVSLNIYAFLKAQKLHRTVKLYCSIGDEIVDHRKYSEIVNIAKEYINSVGGFEKFAEWGFI